MKEKAIILKPGKEKPVQHRHHWIFSGAVQSAPHFDDGDILPVSSPDGQLLGHGYANSRTSIMVRMVSFGDAEPLATIRESIDRAIAMREQFFDPKITNAYRLVHGEGDGIPGLTVDRYGDVLVIQVLTLGIAKLKPMIVEYLNSRLKPRVIYEKSNLPGRKEEGLGMTEELLTGKEIDEVEIIENSHKFVVSIKHGQKTGFFLDQREMRRYAGELATGKQVLNCFGYTGGFSVYALAGGAASADTVDQDEKALELARENIELNGFDSKKNQCIAADVFEFLRQEKLSDYQLVILDPPAFAKRKTDVVRACRGYKDINRLAMEKMPAGSMLITSSCSYHVDEKLFQTVVFQAAHEAGRMVRIIGRHRQASDHPVNIFHPEGEYLKSLVLLIQ